jgi:hypothetical protein
MGDLAILVIVTVCVTGGILINGYINDKNNRKKGE